MERMAAEFIPTVMSRGFHAGPVFGIFGAAIAAAKLGGLNAEQIHSAIAQCVNLAAGNLEGARSGGRSLREGGAVRNALLAVAMAKHGTPGGETTLEGEAGFITPDAGNNLGRLSYSFTVRTDTDIADITQGLGRDWMFLETLYRIYSTAGYNIAHVDVTAQPLRGAQHQLRRHRSHSGGGQLVRDRIPKPCLPHAGQRWQAHASAYPGLHRVWRSHARLPVAAWRAAGARRDSTSALVLDLMHRVTRSRWCGAPCLDRASPCSPIMAATTRTRALVASSFGISRNMHGVSRHSGPGSRSASPVHRIGGYVPQAGPVRHGRRKADRADHPALMNATAPADAGSAVISA